MIWLENLILRMFPRTVWVTAQTKPEPTIWGNINFGGDLRKQAREWGKATGKRKTPSKVFVKEWLLLWQPRAQVYCEFPERLR